MARIDGKFAGQIYLNLDAGNHVLIGINAEVRIHVWVTEGGKLRLEGPMNETSKTFVVESKGITHEDK